MDGKLDILLLGDFSSFHKYLKTGLEALGHNVLLAANGDGFKKIKSDIALYKFNSRYPFVRHGQMLYTSLNTAKKFKNFDVVQLMNTLVYPAGIAEYMMKKLKKRNKMVSLVAAGGDVAVYEAWKKRVFGYYTYDCMLPEEQDKIRALYEHRGRYGVSRTNVEKKIISEADIIIPTSYEYYIAHVSNKNLYADTIPMPVDLNSIKYEENIVNNKMVIFHGLNREDKGTKFIRPAMERIQKKYPDRVEIILKGHMPLDDYMQLLKRTNVVIDQCCSRGYGINALISMAQGKVVLTPSSDETLKVYNIQREECPLFDIGPNIDQIEQTLDFIVTHSNSIPALGKKSRQYVEKYNDCKKVAQRYVDAWRSTGMID